MFGFSAGKSEKVKDLVCGMEIEKEKAKASLEYEGKTYYFCSEDCKHTFELSPQQFIKR